MRSVRLRSSAPGERADVAFLAFPDDRGVVARRGVVGVTVETRDGEVAPAADEPLRPRDAVARVEHALVRLSRTACRGTARPRPRTTRDRRSSARRARRKSAMPSAAMKRATLLSRSNSASGRQTTAGAVIGGNLPVRRTADSVRQRSRAPMTTKPVERDDRLVWIDLEMTGLDVERDVIVEIACIVTDADARRARRRHRPRRARRRRDARAGWTTSSARCTRSRDCCPRSSSRTSTSPTPQKAVLDYVKQHVPTAVDRAAVRQQHRHRPPLPRRATCASSTTTCTTAASTCRRSRSCAGAGTPRSTASGPGKAEHHRALDDIRESIEELRFYREHLLRLPEPYRTGVTARLVGR